ncbi:MAG: carboxypeptidase-like regulatory domain-containing protein [Candidatus Poribacteria bacterium]|nr:carboxypeptidase-like regulatory domain-containing protein [Candidatus Poribacteria bacterium]
MYTDGSDMRLKCRSHLGEYVAKPHLPSGATDMRLETVLIKRGNSQCGSMTLRCLSCLLAIALIFFTALSALQAQTAGLGDIQGTVIDRKLEKPLVSHPVTLTIHKTDAVETQETTTDENGNYRFAELPLDPSVYYTVATVHEDTDYTEKDLVLSTWVPNLKIDFDIGAFADDSAQIRVKTHSFIIGPPPADHPPDGAVTVAEAIGIENLSALPFRTTHGTQKVGVNLTLPRGVEGLQPHSPNLTMDPNTNQILLKTPLPPGELHLGYEYIFHIEKDRLDLSRRLNFNTGQFFVFVPEGIGIVPRGKFFGAPRREQIHNNVYLIYESDKTQTFAAGKKIDLALNINMGAARGALPGQTSNLGQLIFIAVAAALTGGFFVAALFKLRAASNTTESDTDDTSTPPDAGWLLKLNPDDREHVRVARLEFITHLDDKYERQEISERVYKRLRREQTERLTTLLEQQKRGNNA